MLAGYDDSVLPFIVCQFGLQFHELALNVALLVNVFIIRLSDRATDDLSEEFIAGFCCLYRFPHSQRRAARGHLHAVKRRASAIDQSTRVLKPGQLDGLRVEFFQSRSRGRRPCRIDADGILRVVRNHDAAADSIVHVPL